ncbi:MAG: FIST C-terminal domain-containing protein [Bacilli bacterium]|nr:FIST C-terminal domain-containing protein [Bacilli bacterium]
MLRSKVGHSINADSFNAGVETAKSAMEGLNNTKVGFLFTSVNNDIKEVINGVESVSQGSFPVIGCTSSGMIMTNDGIISSENGFAGMMMLDDENMSIGVACSKSGSDARAIGREVAKKAMANANKNVSPAYFYMVASPKEEEYYLMGIQDVIGRVPMFGGSAADDTVEGKWSIYLNDEIFSDGVAVAFIYTDNIIATTYTGAFNESKNVGIVTEVKDDRRIVSIDGVPALKKYGEWINATDEELNGLNLLATSITKPLGVKDQVGNLTVVRHPMVGNVEDSTINVGNKVVKNTALIQLEATVDELINSTEDTLNDVTKKVGEEIGAYFLVHCGGRKLGIGDRIDEVHKKLVAASNGVPFITIFTFGEYGYNENSANMCGGLMLSFTAFGKN